MDPPPASAFPWHQALRGGAPHFPLQQPTELSPHDHCSDHFFRSQGVVFGSFELLNRITETGTGAVHHRDRLALHEL
jgi:hypothetical protein